MKRAIKLAAFAGAAALALAACGQAPEDSGSTASSSETSAAASGGASDYTACMVSDSGGFDDRSFNQSGYEGLEKAKSDLGIKVKEAESQADTDFTPNIDNMVQQGCNLVIGVGFLLEDPIQEAATANPDVDFALIDSAFSDADFKPVTLENGKPILFNTSEAAFLAGYLAGGMSQSGTVATFGGMKIPSVAIFMDGFVDGVAQYNKDAGKQVKVLGWDKASQNGSFTGDFEDQSKGKNLAQGFLDQGADIIMPVAGPVGLGAASAVQAAGKSLIWVDADGYNTAVDYKSIMLTSVVKEIGAAVFDTVKEASEGNFTAESYVGTLENGGVGLAPYHDYDSKIPADLKSKVDEYKKKIESGELKIESPNSPS